MGELYTDLQCFWFSEVLPLADKRVLIIYYSFTRQTRQQVKKFAAGLESEGVFVGQERLQPIKPYEYPFPSYFRLFLAMVTTFFKRRMSIEPLSEQCYQHWDLIVLAGPTWSYHPSGPMLAFLAEYAKEVCGGRRVLPLISCRAYWRLHYYDLKRALCAAGAVVDAPIVFNHPAREPWRLIGLILQLRGTIAKHFNSWLKNYYPGYGHSPQQREDALEYGRTVAASLGSKNADAPL